MAEEAPVITPTTSAPISIPAAAVAPSAPAPIEAVQAAPVASAPPASTTPSAVVAPTPASAVETAPSSAVEAVVAPKAETIIGEALTVAPPEKSPDPKVETKTEPDATKMADGETKAQEGQTEDPAPPPSYEPFTVPEGVTLDTERITKFTEILADLEKNAKGIDHALVQGFGQKAVDFHVEEVKNAVEALQKSYMDVWDRQKTEWKDSFLKDPEIGGNRWQTTVTAARDFIRTHGGTPDQQQEFRTVMESSGLGNHPAVIRLLANAGTAMGEGKPLGNIKPATPKQSKTATLYGKSA